VSGSYFEACNCEAICPCRRVGGRPGGRSTYGICDFVLSWWILEGRADETDLAGLKTVLAGSYSDDEPRSPWRVTLYVDDRADAGQRDALSDIFLGRLGGTPFNNFANAIGEVHAVRTAHIELDHTPNKQKIEAGGYITVLASEPVLSDEPVSCGIPGHDRLGQELRTSVIRADDAPLQWDVRGRCGFASDFDYRSDDR
jgi:hypothetical protein